MRVPTAVVQMRGERFESARNRARTAQLAAEAARDGARLVVLPELVISGYVLEEAGLRQAAEPLGGPTLEAWSAIAARDGIWIAGGFCEAEAGQLYNSAILVGPAGLVLHYRKLHLFDREKLIFSPGDKGLPVVETAIGRIGLCVCYDLRFVEVLRALALQGAQIVAVPTAWVGGFDRNPRDEMGIIGQARGVMVQANLNQIFVSCASQAGSDGDVRFLGSSLVVDPFGAVIAGPLGEGEEKTAYVSIDLEAVDQAQVRSPLVRPREDRRTDVYGLQIGERRI